MFGAESLPDRGQALDRLAELQGAASQANGVDGAGGGTDDDRERIAGTLRQQVGDGGQDADLVGRAGAAPERIRPVSGGRGARGSDTAGLPS